MHSRRRIVRAGYKRHLQEKTTDTYGDTHSYLGLRLVTNPYYQLKVK